MSVTLHTELGDIKIELFCEQCPKTCENFLALAASEYYDNCLFHRNIKGFMVQTGDPTGTGKGGQSIFPGGKFNDEIKDVLKHKVRGMVSMANSGPNTNGSQFFITYAAQQSLDLKYTVFGKVIDGFDVLDELEKAPVNAKFRPLKDIQLFYVTIHANPLANNYKVKMASLRQLIATRIDSLCQNQDEFTLKICDTSNHPKIWNKKEFLKVYEKILETLNMEQIAKSRVIAFCFSEPNRLFQVPVLMAGILAELVPFCVDPRNQTWNWIRTALSDFSCEWILCDTVFVEEFKKSNFRLKKTLEICKSQDERQENK